MTKQQGKGLDQQAKVNETKFIKELMWTNRIVKWLLIVILFLMLLGGIGGYLFIQNALQPVNPKNKAQIEVTVPLGSGTRDIAAILQKSKVIKNADIFSYYLKFNNDKQLQAGQYTFSQDMSAAQIVKTLQEGGAPIFVDADTKITVIEGMQLEEIAQAVGEKTAISQEEFMKTVNDKDFIKQLQEKYPSFLEGVLDHEGVRYPLEGYLFPATYDYFAGMKAPELIDKMVAAANLVYQGYTDDLANTYLTYHQVLTLASIIEREANTVEDRGLISGVFYNRLDAGMPLESDITVLYALNAHKERLSNTDVQVDSPYNLYRNTGLGPGPFNTPGRTAIEAAIYPTWNNYYYFVADLDTGKVYYSQTFEEHQAKVEQYVNNRPSTTESEAASDQTVSAAE